MMPDSISIRDVKKGDVLWECHGSNVLVVALEDAHDYENKEEFYPPGTMFHAYNINVGACFRMFEADKAGGYGPRLYSKPQYTGTDFMDLLIKLSRFYQNGGIDGVVCNVHNRAGS